MRKEADEKEEIRGVILKVGTGSETEVSKEVYLTLRAYPDHAIKTITFVYDNPSIVRVILDTLNDFKDKMVKVDARRIGPYQYEAMGEVEISV